MSRNKKQTQTYKYNKTLTPPTPPTYPPAKAEASPQTGCAPHTLPLSNLTITPNTPPPPTTAVEQGKNKTPWRWRCDKKQKKTNSVCNNNAHIKTIKQNQIGLNFREP